MYYYIPEVLVLLFSFTIVSIIMVSSKNKPHNFMVQNLSMSYLNINGLHRKEFGCKLESFQNEIFQHDIVILSETWGCKHEKILSRTTKILLKSSPQKLKESKMAMDSGGIIVYVHNSIHKLIIPMREHKNYCIFRVSKHLVPKIDIDVVIAAIYIPPEKSSYFSDQILDNLKHDLYEIQNEDNVVIVLGDIMPRQAIYLITLKQLVSNICLIFNLKMKVFYAETKL